MNPFTRHPRQQGVSYAEHLRFALVVAWRLSKSVIAFAVHAMLPFISIPRELDLEASAGFLLERNRWIESAAANRGKIRDSETPLADPKPGLAIDSYEAQGLFPLPSAAD